MNTHRSLSAALVGAALSAVAIFGFSGAAGAATGPTGATGVTITTSAKSASFTQAQQQLEIQLANRSTQLKHLLSDVSGAKLIAGHAATLTARLLTEQSSIDALIAKVPNDTTKAELRADQSAMLKDNRVYAVMTPQVFEIIEADVVVSQVATLQANEPTLQSEVSSLVGLPGYQNALNHYNNYVKRVSSVSSNMATTEGVVLAQTPQGYPKNREIFVDSNHEILNANVSLAYAAYDASVIALATGGYTGS